MRRKGRCASAVPKPEEGKQSSSGAKVVRCGAATARMCACREAGVAGVAFVMLPRGGVDGTETGG